MLIGNQHNGGMKREEARGGYQRAGLDQNASVSSLVLVLLMSQCCGGIELDDERIQERWKSAREYSLSRICYVQNTFVDCRFEIGPPNVSHTLAGMEFPWRHPGGRFRDDLTRKFVWPANVKPTIRSVRYEPIRGISRDWTRPGWRWPVGATFFELHLHEHGHAFELRVLEKVSNGAGFRNYETHVFRPFTSPDDLPFKVSLREVVTLEVDSKHTRKPFVAREKVHIYRDANVDWSRIVDKVWTDDVGHEWHHAGAGDGWLSPKNYAGWMVGSGDRCNKCHDNTGDPVDYFDVASRDWYGNNRGDDGIFSFDPVDRRSVSTRGAHSGGWRWTEN